METHSLIDCACYLFADLQEQIDVAVHRRLGPGDWNEEKLKGRLEIKHEPGYGPEVHTYYLDGKPLLRVHGLEAVGEPGAIRFKRRIQHLKVPRRPWWWFGSVLGAKVGHPKLR